METHLVHARMRYRTGCAIGVRDHFRNGGILRALKKYCKRLRLDARVEIETDRSSEGPL